MRDRRNLARHLGVAAAVVLALACGDAGVPDRPAQEATAVPAGSGGVNRAEHLDKPFLVLISFDGFRADYLERFDLPNFRRLIQRGARAPVMRPVFPSITFPNHYSLVTGLYPEHHGIVGNSFYDPERGASYSFRNHATVADGTWYGGEPIWVTGERQGMVTACFFWPGSEAVIKGIRPTHWNKYDGSVANSVRIETVLDWLRLPRERRPHMITLYFAEIDAASHRGPLDGPAVAAAVASMDATLGRLLDGVEMLEIRDRVFIVATSDHGMVETSAAQTVQLSSLVDTTGIRAGFSGPVAGLHVSGGLAEATGVRDRLNASKLHGRAYLRQEVPVQHHFRAHPRIGDVVIIMDEGWTLATSSITRGLIQSRWGEHGWDPALASMGALFVIAGPGISSGVTIPEVENVDVYPLLTELLGLQAAPGIDGRPGRIRALIQKGNR